MGSRGRRVDCGASSFLPVCPDCSWRGFPRATKLDAQRVSHRHAAEIHGELTSLNAATRRRLGLSAGR